MTAKMRALDTATLDEAAKFRAGEFIRPSIFSRRSPKIATMGREWVLQGLSNLPFGDEFDHLVPAIKGWMGPSALEEFEVELKKLAPRSDAAHVKELAKRLAITPDGKHIPGKVGTIVVGGRAMGTHLVEIETTLSKQWRKENGLDKSHRRTEHRVVKLNWPIYAGEEEERAAGSSAVDPFPSGSAEILMALNTRIANVIAIKMCDIAVDELDTGTVDGILVGRTGAQVADPDTTPVGTILFEHDLATPAFGAAVDAAPGGIATAGAVADDISANATGTLGWLRGSSSNVFPTPLDDLIDGEAGTSGADFNYNTLAIVIAATVSLTSWTVTVPEG